MCSANSIKWSKGDSFDNFIFRSSFTKQCRIAIQQQPKYQTRKRAYLIENNPLNPYCQCNQAELQTIERFFNNNNECNADPFVELNINEWKPLKSVLKHREILSTQGNIPAMLIGQKETSSKLIIAKDTILGQYIGYESTKNEWDNMYRGTKLRKLKYRMQYLCHNTLPFKNNENLKLVIDPFQMNRNYPMNALHTINDCRFDISSAKLTEQDKQRQNCEFISVLVNGWQSVLIRTTKTIATYQSLWIYYGDYYGLLFANKATIISNEADVIILNKMSQNKRRYQLKTKIKSLRKQEIIAEKRRNKIRSMATLKALHEMTEAFDDDDDYSDYDM